MGRLKGRLASFLFLGLVLAACTAAESNVQTSNTSPIGPDYTIVQRPAGCPTYEGFPVVWEPKYRMVDGRLELISNPDASWLLEDSTFVMMSADFAQTPTSFGPHFLAEARACVDPSDNWLVVAQSPRYSPDAQMQVDYSDVAELDEDLWDSVKANPWRLVSFGLIGQADETPTFQGTVYYTDEFALVSSSCSALVRVIELAGDEVATRGPEFRDRFNQPLCTVPSGVELSETEQRRWSRLPTSGQYRIEDGNLVITYLSREFIFEPITMGEFETLGILRSDIRLDDPLGTANAPSFEETDRVIVRSLSQYATTTTVAEATTTTTMPPLTASYEGEFPFSEMSCGRGIDLPYDLDYPLPGPPDPRMEQALASLDGHPEYDRYADYDFGFWGITDDFDIWPTGSLTKMIVYGHRVHPEYGTEFAGFLLGEYDGEWLIEIGGQCYWHPLREAEYNPGRIVDVRSSIDEDTTKIEVTAIERGCAGGPHIPEKWADYRVVENDEHIIVYTMVQNIPVSGWCTNNPRYDITVELPTPIGDRTLWSGDELPLRRMWPRVESPCLIYETFICR